MPSFELSPELENELMSEGKKEYPLLPEGDYPFQVIEAVDATSKAGNPMINMTLSVWDNDGKPSKVWDRLVFTEKALFRVRNFCKATGLDKNWEARKVNREDVEDTHGKVHIKIEPASTVNGVTYKAKNAVDYYIEGAGGKTGGDAEFVDNQDVPF